jgi:hypothetical protein
MLVEFNAQELEVMRDVLRHSLSELDTEIVHTDSHDFKEMLKHRKAMLAKVLHKTSAFQETVAQT